MKHAAFIAIGAALILSAVLQLCTERSRRNYWRGVEQTVEQRATEALAAQELAIKSLKEATNQMHQANAASRAGLLLLNTIKIPSGPILETNRDAKFYDDRTNLVLTVIYTNGTWIAIKP